MTSGRGLVAVMVAAAPAAIAALEYRRARREMFPELPWWLEWDDDTAWCRGCMADPVVLPNCRVPREEDANDVNHNDGCKALALDRALDQLEKAMVNRNG